MRHLIIGAGATLAEAEYHNSPQEFRPPLIRDFAKKMWARAIGDGLDLAEVRRQLQDAKAVIATLEAQLVGLSIVSGSPTDRERIARCMADRRGILRRGPAMARQILGKILPGKRPLALTPLEGGGVSFQRRDRMGCTIRGTRLCEFGGAPGGDGRFSVAGSASPLPCPSPRSSLPNCPRPGRSRAGRGHAVPMP